MLESLHNVAFTDSADLALCLREDHIRLQCFKLFNIDGIDTQRLKRGLLRRELALRELFDLGIDLRAVSIDIDLHGANHRQ